MTHKSRRKNDLWYNLRPMDITEIEKQVDDTREDLKRLLRERGTNQRTVEIQCGWSRGYLSQVFQGRITLTLVHVLAILTATGTSVAEFFHPLDDRSTSLPLDEIRSRLDRYDAQFEELRHRGLLDDESWKGRVGESS
ncbi:MAG: helix-turn-helix domain-containing protein [Thermoanaerobaculia bacterium]|nr:helix-turn-helix domain-containing protein [Thermoanaerobaculia bacterium]